MDLEVQIVAIIFLISILLVFIRWYLHNQVEGFKSDDFGHNYIYMTPFKTGRHYLIFNNRKIHDSTITTSRYQENLILNLTSKSGKELDIKQKDFRTNFLYDKKKVEIIHINNERFISIIIDDISKFYFRKDLINNIYIENVNNNEIGFIDQKNKHSNYVVIVDNKYKNLLEIFTIAFIISSEDS